jgi:hypothetical protein
MIAIGVFYEAQRRAKSPAPETKEAATDTGGPEDA